MSAYLFVHFTMDHTGDKEAIWFSISRDGLHWTDLGGEAPILSSESGTKGIRDPFIVYDESLEKYFMIATDLNTGVCDWYQASHNGSRCLLTWESKDLIHWSKERLIEVGVPGAGCVWAPEAIYCQEKSMWFVFWASCVKEPEDAEAKHRIYGAFTKDFVDFTPAFKYIEGPLDIIDTDIVWENGWYYRFSKDEVNKVITLERSRKLIPEDGVSYERIESKLLDNLMGVEGPEAYYLEEQQKWCLIVDQFLSQQGYLPLVTDDLSTGVFEKLDEDAYDMGNRKKRHGGIIKISDEMAKKLIEHYEIL